MRLLIVLLMCGFSAGCEAEQSKKCIAEAVYFEARNQPFHGQIAVANVIRNRAKRKHKSVCAIIKERKQFSYRDHGVPKIKNKPLLRTQDKKTLKNPIKKGITINNKKTKTKIKKAAM